MKMIRIALLASVCLATPVAAQEMRIDLSKLPPDVSAAVLKAEQDRKGGVHMPTTVEEAEKYAQVGEQVAKAVSATAKGLSIEVNEFVKTPVGKWTFIIVFWYFLGAKLWHIVGGLLIFIIGNTMAWKSMSYFLRQRRVMTYENGREKKYEYKSYEFDSDDAKAGAIFIHMVVFLAVNLVSFILMF